MNGSFETLASIALVLLVALAASLALEPIIV